jgi:hypothetical protein
MNHSCLQLLMCIQFSGLWQSLVTTSFLIYDKLWLLIEICWIASQFTISAIHVVSKESRRLVLRTTYCSFLPCVLHGWNMSFSLILSHQWFFNEKCNSRSSWLCSFLQPRLLFLRSKCSSQLLAFYLLNLCSCHSLRDGVWRLWNVAAYMNVSQLASVLFSYKRNCPHIPLHTSLG